MNPYEDTADAKDIIDELNDIRSDSELLIFIKSKFKNWIVQELREYSPDYPHLTENWAYMCHQARIEPKSILLVREIVFDEHHKVMSAFCEKLTRAGYVVRRIGDIFPCETCGRAIICSESWFMLRKKGGFRIPDMWSEKCVSCSNN